MDYNPPGSSAYGISQARILEWVAISFSRGSFLPRDWTQVSSIAGRFFNNWATREEGGDICIYILDPHCCTVETNAVSYSNYTLIEKKKKVFMFPLLGACIPPQIGELRSHMLRDMDKKKLRRMPTTYTFGVKSKRDNKCWDPHSLSGKIHKHPSSQSPS